jgi:hypothetical protein
MFELFALFRVYRITVNRAYSVIINDKKLRYSYNKIILILIVIFTINKLSTAQNNPSVFSLGWDNDFVFQTDYYFTNGMSLELWNNKLRISPLNLLLIPNNESQTVFYGITFRQDMFTPINKLAYAPLPGDRPYASYWLIGQTKQIFSEDRSMVITSVVYFGMSGEKGGGEWVQNGIHDLLPNSGHVNGWSNQINGSFCLDYQFNAEKQFYRNHFFRFSASGGAMIGAPFTNLNGGIQIYFGQIGAYPDLFFIMPQKNFQIYGFSKVESKWVLYNATLEGRLFNNAPSDLYINPNPFVFQVKLGLNMRYKRFSMEMGANLITPEFHGARTHKWGYFRFSFIL